MRVRLGRSDCGDEHRSKLAGLAQFPFDLVAPDDGTRDCGFQPVERFPRFLSRDAQLGDEVALRLSLLRFGCVGTDGRPTSSELVRDVSAGRTPCVQQVADSQDSWREGIGAPGDDRRRHANGTVNDLASMKAWEFRARRVFRPDFDAVFGRWNLSRIAQCATAARFALPPDPLD